jgi:uncharacterized protein (DUF1015 family)
MTRIHTFDGYLVRHECLEKVVSPAYDSLSPAERHAFGEAHPHNYINAMRSRDEYPASQRPSLDKLLEINAAHLRKMIDKGDFTHVAHPSIFIYRLSTGGHQQTAVVCEIPIDHYHDGRVLKHEHTQSAKEDLLTGYLDVVGAASSPVCLAYPENSAIDGLVDAITGSAPLFEFSAHDDVTQTLWQISDAAMIQRFADQFSGVDKTYLTDGHHRFAAGSRFAQIRRSQNPDYLPEENFNYVLVALFPSEQLRILPYNRCVKDLNGMAVDQFLSRLGETFGIDKTDNVGAVPTKQLEYGMFLGNNWYKLTLKQSSGTVDDPVKALDVSILQDRILAPMLGIHDARSDERLDYVTGDLGMSGLEQRHRDGWAVAFACHPTSIEELMQVADSGEVMPPKSTYFDPKMRSGIFLRLY